jgi:hypothetical protein
MHSSSAQARSSASMLSAGASSLSGLSAPVGKRGVVSAWAVAHRRTSHRRRDSRLLDVYHLPPPSGPPELRPVEDAAGSWGADGHDSPMATQPGSSLQPTGSGWHFDAFSARISLERLYRAAAIGVEASTGAVVATDSPGHGNLAATARTGTQAALPVSQPDSPEADVLAGSVLAVATEQPQKTRNTERSPDYFANLGDVIRTLRQDIPELFNRDLNCERVWLVWWRRRA